MADSPADERLKRAERFFLALGAGHVDEAARELAADVTYHCPGATRLSGTFVGRAEVVRRFRELLSLTSHSIDPIKWEDWMVGVNLVAVLCDMQMEAGLRILRIQALFVVGFKPDGLIGEIRLFSEDQERLERFLGPL